MVWVKVIIVAIKSIPWTMNLNAWDSQNRHNRHKHNRHALSVHSEENNQRMKVIGYNANASAKVVHGLMLKWNFLQVIAKVDEWHRGGPEQMWVPGDGIEIFCIDLLYEAKVDKVVYSKKLKNLWLNI